MLRRIWPIASLLLLAVLSACDGDALTAPLATPGGPAAAMELRCTVSVAAATLVCERPGGAARGELLLGGQGVRVKLTSSNVSIDPGTSTLQTDVTVRNLMSQAIGTPDGTTVSGVRVFFHQLPTVTEGSGTVTVQNPDGLATYTAANQPYFLYDEILYPQGTSAAKTWRFTVPSTATVFVFSVYVAAAAPVEAGVTRWAWESGSGMPRLFATDVWGASDSSVFVVGNSAEEGGSVMYWNGHAWTELLGTNNSADRFNGVSGTSERDVWVTSPTELLHYTGNTWTRYPTAEFGEYLEAVWAGTPSLAFAVGRASLVRRWNGSAWTVETVPNPPSGAADLHAVWGSSPTDVWVVGDNGRVLHYDGVAWSLVETGTTAHLSAVWGSSPTDVWAVGYHSGFRTAHIVHYDGTGWEVMAPPEAFNLVSVWGSGPSEVYALGVDKSFETLMLRWDGSTWSRDATVTQPSLEEVWGSADGTFYAVGVGWDNVVRKTPTTGWVSLNHMGFQDVEAISATDVYAVGTGVLHWNGVAWSTPLPRVENQYYRDAAYDGAGTLYMVGTAITGGPTVNGMINRVVNGVPGTPTLVGSKELYGVWADASTAFAVGQDGTILRSSGGGAFAPMASGTTQSLFGAWGSSSTNVFAVGTFGTIRRYNGTSWSSMPSGTTAHLYAVHGNGPSDVWAVGLGGTVLHYDGSTWTPVPTGSTATLQAVWEAPDGSVYVAGYQALMRYANGAWGRYMDTYDITGLSGLSASEVYAVGGGSLILHGQR
jgi:hypothetical protein